MKRVIYAAALAAVLGAAHSANAQTPYATQPVYQPQPPPPNVQAGNGEYVAPLQQQTQPTYVPQSVALSGPKELPHWSEGEPIPPGYHPVSRVRTGLIAAGLSIFLPFYAISALAGAASIDIKKYCVATTNDSCKDAAFLFVPVVGPFIEMANSSGSAAVSVLLALDGLVQAGGLTMFIMGVAWPRVTLIRNDLANVGGKTLAKSTGVTLEPMIGAQNGFKITF